MVRDEPLRQLLESITNDVSISSRLKTAPAAMKIHHAFRGGLLEHILSLCNLAAALTAHYPRLNLDWLIAGAILHDLGKIETLELTGVRFAYTTRGQLIEHVTLGLEILERHVGRFPGFPLELKTILQHFIVSHHGDLDKGALRRPMVPEAFALSLLDLMDARLEQVFRLIDSAPAGEKFTSYVPSLERQLFRGFENSQNRALNRKPSKEVKQHEHRINCNHGPRGSKGIEHVRDRRVAGCSGRNGGAGSRGKQWGDFGRNHNRLGDLRRRVRIQGGSHRELPEGSES